MLQIKPISDAQTRYLEKLWDAVYGESSSAYVSYDRSSITHCRIGKITLKQAS